MLILSLAVSSRSVSETAIMNNEKNINEQKSLLVEDHLCFAVFSQNANIAHFSDARKVKLYFLYLRELYRNCV